MIEDNTSLEIILYENERYAPFSNSFSRAGLLPTDRKAFSSNDGVSGFPSMNEADVGLLSLGWKWVEPSWALECENGKEGWRYWTDFSSIGENGGLDVKLMTHFVRRRAFKRTQVFDAHSIDITSTPLPCDHCDVGETDKVAQMLLEKLARASIMRHPRVLTAQSMNMLKNDFLQCVLNPPGNVYGNGSRRGHFFGDYSYEATSRMADDFCNGCAGIASFASSTLVDNPQGELNKRMDLLVKRYFLPLEARELAKLLLRRLDSEYRYHCDVVGCGDDCVFAPETCPHLDCSVSYSRKSAAMHDTACPHKVLDCERGCGHRGKRSSLARHLQKECDRRPAKCPFFNIGCDEELTHCLLSEHAHAFQSQHLDLTVARMMEQQGVIQTLYQKVKDLEDKAEDTESYKKRINKVLLVLQQDIRILNGGK